MLVGVTDTHALIWFATNQHHKLGRAARRIFEAADRKDGTGLVVIPTVVLHEISSLLIANKIKMTTNFSQWVGSLKRHGFLSVVDVSAEMVVMSDSFKSIVDPFDRLIMGCAALSDQPLITMDEKIVEANLIATVWD